VLCGISATAIDGKVHGGSDGVLHFEQGVRGAPQPVEKDWTAPSTLLTVRVDLRWCKHGASELLSTRCGTNGPASCAEFRGVF
jgi:hypothetical protein